MISIPRKPGSRRGLFEWLFYYYEREKLIATLLNKLYHTDEKNIILFAYVCLTLLLVGCSTPKTTSTPEIKIACVNVQPTLDHTSGYDSWQVVRFGLGQTVVKYTNDCKVVPWLCDFQGKIFTVKDGIKFSDGTPVTAQDICASLDNVCAKLPRAKYMMRNSSWKVIDATHFEYNGSIDILTEPAFVIAKNGLYTGGRLESHDSNKSVILRNGKRYIFNRVNDPVVRGMAFKKGEVDIALDVPKAYYNENAQEVKGLRTIRALMNLRRGRPLADLKLRQALVYSLNIDKWEKSLQGIVKPGRAYSPLTKSVYKYDFSKAQQLTKSKKVKLKLYYCGSTRQELQTIAESTQAEAALVGIDIELHNVAYELLLKVAKKGQYDLLLTSATNIQSGSVENFFRMNFATGYPENSTGYSNPEFDKAKTYQEMQDIIDRDCLAVVYGYPIRNVVSKQKIGPLGPIDFYYPEF